MLASKTNLYNLPIIYLSSNKYTPFNISKGLLLTTIIITKNESGLGLFSVVFKYYTDRLFSLLESIILLKLYSVYMHIV